MTTIVTNQAPTAKPVGVSLRVGTSNVNLIEVPDYDVPVQGFIGGRRIAPGVAEISSPLILCNYSNSDTQVTVEIVRAGSPGLVAEVLKDFTVEAKQTELVPLNGQFLATGEVLRARAANIERIVATISYTVGQAEEDDVS